jgi:hypothetical protein
VKAMKDRTARLSLAGVAIRERYRSGIHRIVRSVWNIAAAGPGSSPR